MHVMSPSAARIAASRPCPQRRSACAGMIVVEFAMASIVVFMLIFGILDFARVHFSRSRLQYAVSQSARFATVGATLDDPNNPGTKMTRQDSILYLVKKLSCLPGIGNSDIKITAKNSAGQTSNGPGGPGDIVTVEATYRVKLVAPYLGPLFTNNLFTFKCGTSFRNEEFR
jgi:Flp pilus assembly protein TadG